MFARVIKPDNRPPLDQFYSIKLRDLVSLFDKQIRLPSDVKINMFSLLAEFLSSDSEETGFADILQFFNAWKDESLAKRTQLFESLCCSSLQNKKSLNDVFEMMSEYPENPIFSGPIVMYFDNSLR